MAVHEASLSISCFSVNTSVKPRLEIRLQVQSWLVPQEMGKRLHRQAASATHRAPSQACQSRLHCSLGLGQTEIFQTEGRNGFGVCKGWGSPSISTDLIGSGHPILGSKEWRLILHVIKFSTSGEPSEGSLMCYVINDATTNKQTFGPSKCHSCLHFTCWTTDSTAFPRDQYLALFKVITARVFMGINNWWNHCRSALLCDCTNKIDNWYWKQWTAQEAILYLLLF